MQQNRGRVRPVPWCPSPATCWFSGRTSTLDPQPLTLPPACRLNRPTLQSFPGWRRHRLLCRRRAVPRGPMRLSETPPHRSGGPRRTNHVRQLSPRQVSRRAGAMPIPSVISRRRPFVVAALSERRETGGRRPPLQQGRAPTYGALHKRLAQLPRSVKSFLEAHGVGYFVKSES